MPLTVTSRAAREGARASAGCSIEPHPVRAMRPSTVRPSNGVGRTMFHYRFHRSRVAHLLTDGLHRATADARQRASSRGASGVSGVGYPGPRVRIPLLRPGFFTITQREGSHEQDRHARNRHPVLRDCLGRGRNRPTLRDHNAQIRPPFFSTLLNIRWPISTEDEPLTCRIADDGYVIDNHHRSGPIGCIA
jgi:hypothetical protein